jgi:hypothetical protein
MDFPPKIGEAAILGLNFKLMDNLLLKDLNCSRSLNIRQKQTEKFDESRRPEIQHTLMKIRKWKEIREMKDIEPSRFCGENPLISLISCFPVR